MNKDGVIMVVNPFKSMSLEELKAVAEDVVTSKREGHRVESFVSYARDIMANLNVSVENPTIPLRECLSIAKDDFYMELCTRLVNGSFDVMSDMLDSDKKELQDFGKEKYRKKSLCQHGIQINARVVMMNYQKVLATGIIHIRRF